MICYDLTMRWMYCTTIIIANIVVLMDAADAADGHPIMFRFACRETQGTLPIIPLFLLTSMY